MLEKFSSQEEVQGWLMCPAIEAMNSKKTFVLPRKSLMRHGKTRSIVNLLLYGSVGCLCPDPLAHVPNAVNSFLLWHWHLFTFSIISFQYEGMWRQKLQTSVSFPMSNLDMSNYVVDPKSTLRYNLHAVSNHYGTIHSGHYTAFAKTVYDKKWYKFDDQYVTEMSPNGVVVRLSAPLCVYV